eukprot:4205324-Ditylum_brightwellii.AAC.1
MEDLDNWSEIVTAVGAVEDCILDGSAFLLLFPPVAATGFVTAIDIMTLIRYDNEYGANAQHNVSCSSIPFSRKFCY